MQCAKILRGLTREIFGNQVSPPPLPPPPSSLKNEGAQTPLKSTPFRTLLISLVPSMTLFDRTEHKWQLMIYGSHNFIISFWLTQDNLSSVGELLRDKSLTMFFSESDKPNSP